MSLRNAIYYIFWGKMDMYVIASHILEVIKSPGGKKKLKKNNVRQ